MNLLDRIHQLQLKAVAADDDHKIKSRSGEFTTLRERIETSIEIAARVGVGRKELEFAGIIQDDYDQTRTDALVVVQDLISTIEKLSVEAKFDTVKTQGTNVEAHFKRSEKFVTSSWKGCLPSTPPRVDDDLLDALEHGGVDVESIRSDIEGAKLTLLALNTRRLPEIGDTAKLQTALATLNSSEERIGEVIDPAIAGVVVRAQREGVPYAEMTPEIISALSELGILNRFRVVLK